MMLSGKIQLRAAPSVGVKRAVVRPASRRAPMRAQASTQSVADMRKKQNEAVEDHHAMFCYQCEQTLNGSGCTVRAACMFALVPPDDSPGSTRGAYRACTPCPAA